MKKKFIAMLAVAAAVSQSVAIAKPFGVCTHMGLGITYDNIANIQSARDTRVEWIRDEARWSDMQSGADGEIKIRDKDLDYIKRVDKARINQLLLLSYGNDNYEGIEADTVFPKQDNETYYNGYLDYVRYTVSQVKDYVDAYEIWNEPNIKGFNYNLLANGTDYAKLYLDAKAIIDVLNGKSDYPFSKRLGVNEQSKRKALWTIRKNMLPNINKKPSTANGICKFLEFNAFCNAPIGHDATALGQE